MVLRFLCLDCLFTSKATALKAWDFRKALNGQLRTILLACIWIGQGAKKFSLHSRRLRSSSGNYGNTATMLLISWAILLRSCSSIETWSFNQQSVIRKDSSDGYMALQNWWIEAWHLKEDIKRGHDRRARQAKI